MTLPASYALLTDSTPVGLLVLVGIITLMAIVLYQVVKYFQDWKQRQDAGDRAAERMFSELKTPTPSSTRPPMPRAPQTLTRTPQTFRPSSARPNVPENQRAGIEDESYPPGILVPIPHLVSDAGLSEQEAHPPVVPHVLPPTVETPVFAVGDFGGGTTGGGGGGGEWTPAEDTKESSGGASAAGERSHEPAVSHQPTYEAPSSHASSSHEHSYSHDSGGSSSYDSGSSDSGGGSCGGD